MSEKKTRRLTLRFTEEDAGKLEYWAEKEGLSVNQFIVRAMERWIDIENGNYELPTLEVQRLNQLVELLAVVSRNQQTLETIITSGFDSLLSLTRGDNYLLHVGDDLEGGEEDA